MKTVSTTILVLLAISAYSQTDDRIQQIRQLYADYNGNLSNWDTYEIEWNTAGAYPSAVIYTDYEGKLLIKTADADEFGSGATEYYFYKDTIQFIYSVSDRLITHWSADTVTYEVLELRYYFDKGAVIKTLKKHFKGIEGQDDRAGLRQIPNKTVNHLEDTSANWRHFEEKIEDMIQFYAALEKLF